MQVGDKVRTVVKSVQGIPINTIGEITDIWRDPESGAVLYYEVDFYACSLIHMYPCEVERF